MKLLWGTNWKNELLFIPTSGHTGNIAPTDESPTAGRGRTLRLIDCEDEVRYVQCDQIVLFLKGLGDKIIYQKWPKYLATFSTIFKNHFLSKTPVSHFRKSL